MRRTLTIAATAATLALGAAGLMTSSAAAGDAGRAAARCANPAGAPWIAGETIRRNLEDLGYRVSRIKVEHGCYEARAVNDSGIPIEVRYDPVTGALVRARLRS